MINQEIAGTDANGNAVTGVVQGVQINNGAATLVVNGSNVPLANVTGIAAAIGRIAGGNGLQKTEKSSYLSCEKGIEP